MPDEPLMRCPRLGGEVTLRYCLREGGDLPCLRILLCWQPFFPIERYLKEKLTSRQWEECFGKEPGSRIDAIVQCLKEAKKGSPPK